MTAFIALATILTLIIVAWLARSLLRPAPTDGISGQRLNAAIYREQLQALERDLAQGAISADEHASARDELQLRLLDDTDAPAPAHEPSGPTFWTSRRIVAALAIILPLLSAGSYVWLGNPAAMQPPVARGVSDAQIAQMVDTLAARLKANPDDPKGWAMLARSYQVMGRLDEAEQAFLRIGATLDQDPDLLTGYAELLALRADNRLEGRPQALITKALAIDPAHPGALMLAGAAAYQRADYAGAVDQWQKLLVVQAPGSEDARLTQTYIDEALSKAAPSPRRAK